MEAYLANIATVILDPIIRLLFVISLAVFFWGIFIMIMNAASEEKRSEGKKHMIWGLIGMLIMILAGGLFEFVKEVVFSLK